MNAAVIGSLARWILGSLGAVGVAKGYFDNDTLTQAVGALTNLVTLAWSIYEKKAR